MVTGMTQSAAEPGAVTAMAAAGEHAAGPMRQVSGVAAEPLAAGAAAIAVFPPAAVAVYLQPPAVGSPRNTWPATVVGLEQGPSAIRVRAQRSVSGGGTSDGMVIAADLTPAAVSELGLQPGMPLYLAVKATEVRIHAG
jgi:molybdate transport system ATP-binding protein